MEWVDLDGSSARRRSASTSITSVLKGRRGGEDRGMAAAGGSFKGGDYIGTLATGGVTLAPFHDSDTKVPASLKSELEQDTARRMQTAHPDTDQEPEVSG